MKSIAYVLSTFPVFSETFIGTEMRAMIARGHKIVPIVLQRSEKPGQTLDEAMRPTLVHLDRVPARAAVRALLTPRPAAARGIAFSFAQCELPRRSLIWNALKIAAVARREGCSHLHAHFAGGAAAHAILAARWIGATVSFVGHGHDIYSQPEDLGTKLDHVDFAVATCTDMALDMKREAANARVTFGPCGVNPDRFRPLANRAEDNGRYLFIARLIPTKGCSDLLRAIALLRGRGLREIKLDIIGDGPIRADLEAEAADLGLLGRVNFLGARTAEWLTENGPRYRALVCTYKIAGSRERDSAPVVAKEAMAMAIPVIATRFMGFKDMITEDCGRLFEPGDVEDLVRALDAFDALPAETRAAMGRAGRARLEAEFSDRRQAELLSGWVEAA